MKVLFNYTIKSLQHNKKRTLFTFLGIILSGSLLFGVGFYISTYYQILIKKAISNNGSHHIEYRGINLEKIKTLKKDNEVKRILINTINNYESLVKEETDPLHYMEITSLNINYKDFFKIEGHSPTKEKEIILPSYLKKNYQYKLGDTVSFKNKEKVVRFTIVGFFEFKEKESLSYYKRQLGDKGYTFFNPQKEHFFNAFVTLNSPKYGFEKLMVLTNKIGLDFPDLNFSNRTSDVIINKDLLTLYGQIREAGDYAILVLSAILIIVVLSLISLLIIYNSFTISIMERKQELGRLTSIGATPWQIIKTIFLEVGLISLISIPLSFIIGLINTLFSITIVNIILKDIISFPFVISLHPFFTLLALTGLLFSIFMASLIPAMEASEISPLENIRLNKDFKSKKIKPNRLILKLFKIEGFLAFRNIKKDKRKYRTTIISLVISMVLFILCATYLKVNLVNNYYYHYQPNYDVYIKVIGEKQQEIIKQIKEIKKTIEYQKQELFIEEINDKFINKDYLKIINELKIPKQKLIEVYTLNNETYQEYIKEIGLKKEQPILINYDSFSTFDEIKQKEIIYEGKVYQESKDLTFKFCNYKDFINLEEIINCYYEIKKPFFTTFKPFGKNNNSPSLIVNQKLYKQLFKDKSSFYKNENDDFGTVLEFKIKHPKKFHINFRQILKRVSNNYFDLMGEDYSSVNLVGKLEYDNYKLENHKNKMTILAFKFIVYSLSAFITLIGIISFISTTETSLNLRKRDFALLHSLGQQPKSFKKMIFWETLFIGVKAMIYGLIISLGLIHIIIKIASLSYGINQITIPFPTIPLLICLLLNLLVIFLTIKYAFSKIHNKNIIETIKKDNI